MKWRAYLPSVFMILLAWVFLTYPWLAGALVGGGLIFMAVLYAGIAHNFIKLSKMSTTTHTRTQDPTFRNVTIHMVKRGRWFESED